MLRCPRTHSGRESGPGSGVGSRLTGVPVPVPRACPGLDVCRRVERPSRCVRPAARAISRGEGGREGGCADGWATVRETVTLAGRAERARAARAFVSEVLGPGHPCGDVAVLLVSEVFSNSVRHSRLGCSRGDGHGRGQGRGRHRPGRGHRPRRAGDAGAASCEPRRGRRPGASARRGPRGAVGLAAAARRADGDLVRASVRLLMPPPGDWSHIYLGCTSDGRGCRCLPAAAQVAGVGGRSRYISGISQVHLRTAASVWLLTGLSRVERPRARSRARGAVLARGAHRFASAFGAPRTARRRDFQRGARSPARGRRPMCSSMSFAPSRRFCPSAAAISFWNFQRVHS